MRVSDLGMSNGYDIHTHSSFSDGTTSVNEIAQEISRLGLRGFSLTDHDTIVGWDNAREAAESFKVDFLPGIEITTKFDGLSRHLLAYGIDANHVEIFKALDEVRASRETRIDRMVENLSVDFSFTLENILKGSDTVSLGRPHLADALIEAGYFANRSEAFDAVLHPDSPYYTTTTVLHTLDAIRLVRAAGGVPVIAHPAATRQDAPLPVESLQQFVEAGLWGIELDHPENRTEWLPGLEAAANEFNLVVTGASDFHGSGKSNRLGDRFSDVSVVERIREIVATPF